MIGETEWIAREKAAFLDSLIDPELVLASSSQLLGVDLSRIETAEQAEREAGNQGIAGSRDRMAQLARAQGISFAAAVRKPRGLLAGTPATIADQMEDWFTERRLRRLRPAADGLPADLRGVRPHGDAGAAAPWPAAPRVCRPHLRENLANPG